MCIAAVTTEASMMLRFGQWKQPGALLGKTNAESVELIIIPFLMSFDYGTITSEKAKSSSACDVSTGIHKNAIKQMKLLRICRSS